MNNISCVGTENSLIDCAGNAPTTICESLEDASIICQGIYSVNLIVDQNDIPILMQAQTHFKPAVWMVILGLLKVLAHWKAD